MSKFKIGFYSFALLVLFALYLSSCASCQEGIDRPDLFSWSADRAEHQSVVIVEAPVESWYGTGYSYGSGSVVWKTERRIDDGVLGLVLTANHVVEDAAGKYARSITIRYKSGRVAKNCRVLNRDAKNDIAIVWAWIPDSVIALKFARTPAEPRERYELVGFGSSGLNLNRQRHFWVTVDDRPSPGRVWFDGIALGGDSGGPILNEAGRIVSIVQGGPWRSGTGLNGNPIVGPFYGPELTYITDLFKKTKLPRPADAIKNRPDDSIWGERWFRRQRAFAWRF